MFNRHPSLPVAYSPTKNNQYFAVRQQAVIHHPRQWSRWGKESVMEIKVSSQQIENLLCEVGGLLTSLYAEEQAGLESTSLRIEINALEAVNRQLRELVSDPVRVAYKGMR